MVQIKFNDGNELILPLFSENVPNIDILNKEQIKFDSFIERLRNIFYENIIAPFKK